MMQGDAYSVPVVIKAKDGTVITPEMATRVEITIGSLSRQWPGVITFNEDTLAWEFPLTQQQSFRLSQGKQKTQVRVVFSNGWVVGGGGTDVRVLKSESRGILATPAQQTGAVNTAFGAVYAEIGALTVILGAGLPDITEETAGKYLTNNGETAEWADVDALPAMSAATKGKMLTNDGEKAEWGGAVRYDSRQQLTDDEKRLARANIDAVTVVRAVNQESELPAVMWNLGDVYAISIGAMSKFSGLYNALTNAGLSVANNTSAFLQHITTNPPQGFYLTHVFNCFTTENEQALVTVLQDISGSHPISGWQATKTADWAQFVVTITSDRDSSGNVTYTADKSSSEIVEASRKGKNVVANVSGSGVWLPLTQNKYGVSFKGLDPNKNGVIEISVNSDKSVTYKETPITDERAVHFTAQTLTADQQVQARANIGLTPVAKTNDMTQSVGLDAETGELWTKPGEADNALGITSASVGQLVQVQEVDENGKPTKWKAVDDRLPAAGAVEGLVPMTQRIEEFEYGYVLHKIPNLDDFIHLGITGASPGQFAKVKYVTDTGQPTAWEAVDMPSGGADLFGVISSGDAVYPIDGVTVAEDGATLTLS